MRSILFSILIFPVVVTAQINRSAKEFASEQIQEYVTSKLFKDLSYKPISFGQLKTFKEGKSFEIAWTIEHKFEVTDNRKTFDQKIIGPREYKFLFYLDEKMKVVRAESFFAY